MLKKGLHLLLFGLFFFPNFYGAIAQSGYQIDCTINGFTKDHIILGYRHGEKILVKDTVKAENGKILIKGEEALPTGIYLVLMPPENKFFEILITQEEQHFTVETTAPEFYKNLKFTNAPDNLLLQDYQAYMSEQIALSKVLAEKIGKATGPEKAKLEEEMKVFQKDVRKHQNDIIAQNPTAFTAKLISVWQEPELPDPPKRADGSIDDKFQYHYFKKHFFDGIDFSEGGLANTQYIQQKIDQYTDKLTPQSPDSVKIAVDRILTKAKANSDMFRFCTSHLLNKYHRPKVVGLDAVYVHISDNYYAKGLAHWVDEDQLKKITDDAYMIRGVLMGSIAPEVKNLLFDNEKGEFTEELISLHGIEAEYIVVFLWKPGCDHCKKMTEELKGFYEKHKDQGVEIYAISSANHRELDDAVKDLKVKQTKWINTADPYMKARALQKFYGRSLPKLYLLDKNKKILASRIGVVHLPNIINQHKAGRLN